MEFLLGGFYALIVGKAVDAVYYEGVDRGLLIGFFAGALVTSIAWSIDQSVRKWWRQRHAPPVPR